MVRWLRVLLAALALASVFLSGAGGASAVEAGHSCDGMSLGANMEDCHGSTSDAATSPDCAAVVCGQATVLPPYETFLARMIVAAAAPLAPRDDRDRGGLSGSPDLRPPIA